MPIKIKILLIVKGIEKKFLRVRLYNIKFFCVEVEGFKQRKWADQRTTNRCCRSWIFGPWQKSCAAKWSCNYIEIEFRRILWQHIASPLPTEVYWTSYIHHTSICNHQTHYLLDIGTLPLGHALRFPTRLPFSFSKIRVRQIKRTMAFRLGPRISPLLKGGRHYPHHPHRHRHPWTERRKKSINITIFPRLHVHLYSYILPIIVQSSLLHPAYQAGISSSAWSIWV